MSKSPIEISPLFGVAIVFVAGTAFGEYALANVPTLWTLVATSVAIVYALWLSDRQGRSVLMASLCTLLAVFLGSAFLSQSRMHQAALPLDGETLEYDAVVLTHPQQHGKIVVFDMMLTNASHADDGTPSDRFRSLTATAILLRDTITRHYERLHAGSAFTALSTFEPKRNYYPSPANRNQWQTFIPYWNWQFAEVNHAYLTPWQNLRIRLLQLRHSLSETLRKSGAGGTESAVAIIAAMTLGDRSGLGKQTREDFSISGASHVLALSGLHLSILYAFLMLLTGRKRRVLSQILCLSAIWLYAIMVGFMPSVVRAATMLTIYGVITAIRRKAYSLNALSLAAIVMLTIRPQNLWDVGFQMSFLAVLGILLIGVPLNSYVKKNIFANYFNFDPDKGPTFGQRSWAWLLGIVVISLATQIMVAPLVAYYFGRFSCYFLLTNIVAIPLVTLILSVAFIFFLLTPFPAMQYFVGQIVMRLAEILSSVLHFIAKLPGSSIEDIHLSPLQLLLVYILEITICFLIVRLVKHIKYWRILLSD